MPTLQELLAQKATLENQAAELERRIAEQKRAERADAIAKVQALMAEYGLTLADLGSRGGAAPTRRTLGKVAAKYRNPATGDSWSGRGLKPKWLQAELDAGRRLEDFAV